GISLFQTLPLAARNHQDTNFVFVKESAKPDIMIPKDWRLLDTLDVGNPQDENNHQYQIKKEARTPIPHFGTVPEMEIKCAGDQAFLWDKGRAHHGAESFSAQSQVGAPLFIVKRFHGDIKNQSVKVFVNGKEAGLWEIPGTAKNSFRSSLFIIPSSFIQSDPIQLTFQTLAPDRLVTSYYYWAYVPSKIPLPRQ
ncbi:MAG: hypothetical protein C0407_16885, partial [Desulfobacca sp.]|nr:hypothetical protein [Desulfobacca sp.]